MATGAEKTAVAKTGASSLAEIPEEVLQKRYNLTRAELNAIKTSLAPQGSTDYEIMLYVGVCNRLRLDPFVPGLVHFARFENRDGSGFRTGIILGVYGYIALAQQDPAYDGFSIKSFPEDPEKPVTHATCTVFRKGSQHPVEVTVLAREAKSRAPKSRLWPDSPRHMTENAAIRRAMRYAYPTLFGAVDEGDEEDDTTPAAARGRVGTWTGDHHDTPALPEPAAEQLERPAAPAKEPVTVEARPAPPAEEPAHEPETPKKRIPTDPKVTAVVQAIVDLMDDPGLREDRSRRGRMNALLNDRLDARHLETIWDAKPEDVELLGATLADLQQIHDGP